jgi:hypothetical protein
MSNIADVSESKKIIFFI